MQHGNIHSVGTIKNDRPMLININAEPAGDDVPPSGYVYMWLDNAELYLKYDNGNIDRILNVQWTELTPYSESDIVIYDGDIYKCISANTNYNPFSYPEKWTLLSSDIQNSQNAVKGYPITVSKKDSDITNEFAVYIDCLSVPVINKTYAKYNTPVTTTNCTLNKIIKKYNRSSIELNGTDSAILITDSAVRQMNSDFTIGLRLLINDDSYDQMILGNNSNTSGNWLIGFDTNTKKIYGYVRNTGIVTSYTQVISKNKWYDITVSKIEELIQFKLDGEVFFECNASSVIFTNDIQIGASLGIASDYASINFEEFFLTYENFSYSRNDVLYAKNGENISYWSEAQTASGLELFGIVGSENKTVNTSVIRDYTLDNYIKPENINYRNKNIPVYTYQSCPLFNVEALDNYKSTLVSALDLYPSKIDNCKNLIDSTLSIPVYTGNILRLSPSDTTAGLTYEQKDLLKGSENIVFHTKIMNSTITKPTVLFHESYGSTSTQIAFALILDKDDDTYDKLSIYINDILIGDIDSIVRGSTNFITAHLDVPSNTMTVFVNDVQVRASVPFSSTVSGNSIVSELATHPIRIGVTDLYGDEANSGSVLVSNIYFWKNIFDVSDSNYQSDLTTFKGSLYLGGIGSYIEIESTTKIAPSDEITDVTSSDENYYVYIVNPKTGQVKRIPSNKIGNFDYNNLVNAPDNETYTEFMSHVNNNNIHLPSNSGSDASSVVTASGSGTYALLKSGYQKYILYVSKSRSGTYTPNGTMNAPYKTINDAINATTDSSTNQTTIIVDNDIYEENITTTKSINIIGLGGTVFVNSEIIISGENISTCLSNCIFENCSITVSRISNNINVFSKNILKNSTIINNSLTSIENCEIYNNNDTCIYSSTGATTTYILNCNISSANRNIVTHNTGKMYIESCTIKTNGSGITAVESTGAEIYITGCDIRNEASDSTSLDISNSGSINILRNCTVAGKIYLNTTSIYVFDVYTMNNEIIDGGNILNSGTKFKQTYVQDDIVDDVLVITHNLNTDDPVIVLKDLSTNKYHIPDCTYINNNTLSLDFTGWEFSGEFTVTIRS